MLLPFHTQDLIEAGLDEAGRGCIAGPVTAAAVILPKDYKNNFLNDSKKLSEKRRDQLREVIIKEAIAWSVQDVSNTVIDKINILKATFLAMHQALDQLKTTPELLLIDGNRFIRYKNIPYSCIVKGDGKYMAIAAASILAKTFRDDWMENAALQYPQYRWEQNKGYPTEDHREAVKEHGLCDLHRKSFSILSPQLSIF